MFSEPLPRPVYRPDRDHRLIPVKDTNPLRLQAVQPAATTASTATNPLRHQRPPPGLETSNAPRHTAIHNVSYQREIPVLRHTSASDEPTLRAKITDLQQQVRDLKISLKAAEDRLASVNDKSAELERFDEEQQARDTRWAQAHRNTLALQGELQQLQRQLETRQKELDEREEQIRTTIAEAIKAKLAEHEEAYNSRVAQMAQDAGDAANAALDKRAQELSLRERLLDRSIAQTAQAQTDRVIADAEQRLKERDDQVDGLRQANHLLRQQVEESQHDLQELRRTHTHLRERLQDSEANLEDLRHTNSLLLARVDSLGSELLAQAHSQGSAHREAPLPIETSNGEPGDQPPTPTSLAASSPPSSLTNAAVPSKAKGRQNATDGQVSKACQRKRSRKPVPLPTPDDDGSAESNSQYDDRQPDVHPLVRKWCLRELSAHFQARWSDHSKNPGNARQPSFEVGLKHSDSNAELREQIVLAVLQTVRKKPGHGPEWTRKTVSTVTTEYLRGLCSSVTWKSMSRAHSVQMDPVKRAKDKAHKRDNRATQRSKKASPGMSTLFASIHGWDPTPLIHEELMSDECSSAGESDDDTKDRWQELAAARLGIRVELIRDGRVKVREKTDSLQYDMELPHSIMEHFQQCCSPDVPWVKMQGDIVTNHLVEGLHAVNDLTWQSYEEQRHVQIRLDEISVAHLLVRDVAITGDDYVQYSPTLHYQSWYNTNQSINVSNKTMLYKKLAFWLFMQRKWMEEGIVPSWEWWAVHAVPRRSRKDWSKFLRTDRIALYRIIVLIRRKEFA
ncbi:hypothetical protein CALCODRAFT_513530 [Calocera cornea HHB12733]|uniref:Uncharacterized protein n=1 Tax=Calocera cornea HHB12733 TaxID=1353952 RepID=A0A165C0C8_9BASI|nr:hypothetical protein CALCODRAFT_513530 [Calocera cornea HHB12733]